MLRIVRCCLSGFHVALVLVCGCMRWGMQSEANEVWLVEAHRLLKYDAVTDSYPVQGEQPAVLEPWHITPRTAGGFWVTERRGFVKAVDSDLHVVWRSPLGMVADPVEVVERPWGLWISDYWGRRVVAVTLDGALRCYRSELSYPTDMIPGPGSGIWVLDLSSRGRLFLLGEDCGVQLGPLALDGGNAIATDGQGGLWVAEAGKVIHLDAQGQRVLDSSDTGAAFFTPQAIVMDGAGWVWMYDGYTGYLYVLDPTDLSVRVEAPGFGYLRSLIAGPDQTVWVARAINPVLSQYLFDGMALQQVIASPGTDLLTEIRDLEVGANGELWVTSNGLDKVSRLSPGFEEMLLTDIGDFGYVRTAVGDSRGAIWVADPILRSTVKLDPAGRRVALFEHARMQNPRWLAVDRHDFAWVADEWSGHVMRLSPSGELSVDVSLGSVAGMWLHATEESVWVARTGPSRLTEIDSRGQLGMEVPWPADRPLPSILVDVDEGIGEWFWVLDYQMRVSQVSAGGEVQRDLKQRWRLMAEAPAGGVWLVNDVDNSQTVMRVDSAGEPVAGWPSRARGQCINGMTAGAWGGVWLVDACDHEITLLDSEAGEMRRWGAGIVTRPVAVVETPSTDWADSTRY